MRRCVGDARDTARLDRASERLDTGPPLMYAACGMMVRRELRTRACACTGVRGSKRASCERFEPPSTHVVQVSRVLLLGDSGALERAGTAGLPSLPAAEGAPLCAKPSIDGRVAMMLLERHRPNRVTIDSCASLGEPITPRGSTTSNPRTASQEPALRRSPLPGRACWT